MGEIDIAWHPGFYSATELDFLEYSDVLEYEREHSLSKEPLKIDFMVIKRLANVEIENDIGRIFRTYNIFEFKSPQDGLSIDDLYKTLGYACLYKAMSDKTDAIPADEITVSLLRDRKPEKLLSRFNPEMRYPGVYYITGLQFPCQIIVSSELGPEHAGLRILSEHAEAPDIEAFLEKAKGYTKQGDKENANSVLYVSINANRKLYGSIREEDKMYSALNELMADELAKREARGEARGEDRLSSLMKNLLTAGRTQDALKVSTDPVYRKQMLAAMVG